MKTAFPFNKRVLIFAATGLLLLDLFIRLYIDWRFAAPAHCRMPCDDPATVGLWIDQVKKARGFKIVFLGDSAVHGLASGTADQSLPAAAADLLEKQCPGKNIKVFNLALEGCGPTETFLIFNALAGAKIDLLVYDLNIAWFSRQKPLEHSNLLALTDRYPDSVDLREMALQQPAAGEPVRGENLIKGFLAPHWKLYHHRVLLNYWLFGKPIRSKLPLALDNPGILFTNREDAFPEIKELRTPWGTKGVAGEPEPPGAPGCVHFF